MSLKDTFKQMRDLLSNITTDLEKSENGNKAASQRVRTGTVKLEKIAKLFRKESISSEKKNKGQKKPSKATGTAKKTAHKAKAAAHGSHSKAKPASAHSKSVKAKPKAKTTHAKTSIRPSQLSLKKSHSKRARAR